MIKEIKLNVDYKKWKMGKVLKISPIKEEQKEAFNLINSGIARKIK